MKREKEKGKKKKTSMDLSFFIGESNVITGHKSKTAYSKLPSSHFRGHFAHFSSMFYNLSHFSSQLRNERMRVREMKTVRRIRL